MLCGLYSVITNINNIPKTPSNFGPLNPNNDQVDVVSLPNNKFEKEAYFT